MSTGTADAETLAAGGLEWLLGSAKPGDLAARATVDQAGVRWANEEHRVTPSVLEPRTGWAMGNAGIIRELLRFSRASAGADPSYAVTWPDHQPAGPTPGL